MKERKERGRERGKGRDEGKERGRERGREGERGREREGGEITRKSNYILLLMMHAIL